MSLRHFDCSRRAQRGAGALIVTMLLLFASSIVVFYLNRGLIFEQKTSANQLRSTTAFEVAEAGLEWATGMLNAPYDISADCSLLATTNLSFRTKYIQTTAGSSNVSVTTRTFPGCKLNGAALTCSCPALPGANDESVASLGTAVLPSFTVTFTDVGDPQAVRVTATGCTAQAGACKPATTTLTPAATNAATTANSDAWAQVSAILKLRPLLRAAPSAALTCGGACNVGGSYDIINRDVASNGYLVNSGGAITLQPGNGAVYGTIPGQPLQNAMIANDASLTAIAGADPNCSNDAMFRTYFGTSIDDYRASPAVKTISCPNGSCNSLVSAAYADGWRSFYFPGSTSTPSGNGVQITNLTLGAAGAGNGVLLVSDGDIQTSGNTTIYGVVFGNSASIDYNGTGGANITGAMITCRNYDSNGNGRLTYAADSLGGTGLRPGVMARVPGSWRDFTP